MWRNFLKGNLGDEFNTIIAATAFNIKKFLNRVKARLRNWMNFYIFSTLRFIIFIANSIVENCCILMLKKMAFSGATNYYAKN